MDKRDEVFPSRMFFAFPTVESDIFDAVLKFIHSAQVTIPTERLAELQSAFEMLGIDGVQYGKEGTTTAKSIADRAVVVEDSSGSGGKSEKDSSISGGKSEKGEGASSIAAFPCSDSSALHSRPQPPSMPKSLQKMLKMRTDSGGCIPPNHFPVTLLPLAPDEKVDQSASTHRAKRTKRKR